MCQNGGGGGQGGKSVYVNIWVFGKLFYLTESMNVPVPELKDTLRTTSRGCPCDAVRFFLREG